ADGAWLDTVVCTRLRRRAHHLQPALAVVRTTTTTVVVVFRAAAGGRTGLAAFQRRDHAALDPHVQPFFAAGTTAHARRRVTGDAQSELAVVAVHPRACAGGCRHRARVRHVAAPLQPHHSGRTRVLNYRRRRSFPEYSRG